MIEWRPFSGMQTRMLQSKAFETLAGGSRGPGKTDAGVMWLAKPYLLKEPRARALVIRKNGDDLADWLDRARFWYKRYGGEVTGQPALVKFPSGYTIRTGHLKDDNAYTKYQGQEYQRQLIEELTQIPEERRYLQLIASCRSTVPGLEARVMATTNPGGVGHVWVKNRWQIDEFPNGNKLLIDKTSGRTRIFLPGHVDDNPVLMENDPNYVKQLDALKDTDVELWRAWRLGDWNTFAGQYFKSFRTDLHTCKPFVPKKGLTLIAGLDWGRTNPFAFELSVLEKVEFEETRFTRVWTFCEAYGTDKTPKEWEAVIKERLKIFGLKVKDIDGIECDGKIFDKGDDGGISIADQFIAANEEFRGKLKRASKDRVGGWENMQNWLSIAPDGLPYWIICENCNNLIKEIPNLIRDEHKVEDVDTTGLDHASDATRYMLKALKWIDGRVGGVVHKSKPKFMKAANMKDDGQVSVNTDAFAIDLPIK